jgi:putative cardiolipin synthase
MAALAAILLACTTLPDLDGRTRSVTVRPTTDTRLGRAVDSLVAAHPTRSGIVPLADGRDAFAARALLAAAADRTLDIQYYIWRADMSGMLLFDAVRQAADRGVRVRLLLDDNVTAGMDTILAALDSHPNIEVRLFNPFVRRRWRYLGYLTDFSRLNRRMHNKSFTADNRVTIIGGRNVGDEYFGAGQGPLFVDLDVLAIGPVVNEVSTDFDRYWASASSYPAGSVLAPASSTGLAHLTDSVEHLERDRAAVAYVEALARQPFVRDLLSRTLDFEWAATKMVSDDPAKGLGRAASGGLLTERLRQAIGAPTSELELVSPYFVPGSDGVDAFAAMAGRGVKVTVLTNSLEATDVAAVHAGYAKRRKPLLEAGVKLFEMKREVSSTSTRTRGLTGSSGSSLHAKTFSVDRSRVFVGSFNFDPRSERLNTEMGFVIDSPELAQRIADSFANEIPERSYEVRLSASRELQWVERSDGGEIVHDVEPGTTFLERAMVAALSVLPIDWLL